MTLSCSKATACRSWCATTQLPHFTSTSPTYERPERVGSPTNVLDDSSSQALLSDGRAFEPPERSLYEWLGVFIDALAMRNDQLIEVPREQLFECSPRADFDR